MPKMTQGEGEGAALALAPAQSCNLSRSRGAEGASRGLRYVPGSRPTRSKAVLSPAEAGIRAHAPGTGRQDTAYGARRAEPRQAEDGVPRMGRVEAQAATGAPPPSARAVLSPRPLLTAGRGAGGGGRNSNRENHAPSGRAGLSLPAAAASQAPGVQRRRLGREPCAQEPPRALCRGVCTAEAPPQGMQRHLLRLAANSLGSRRNLHSPPRASVRAVTPSLGLGTSLLCPPLVPRVRMAFVSSAVTYLLRPSRAVYFTCFPLSSQAPTLPNSAA